MKRLLIATDLDDVLVDLVTPFTDFYNKKHLTRITKKDFVNYDFSQVLSVESQEGERRVVSFLKSSQFEEIQPFSDAVDITKILKRQGHKLVVITSRRPFNQGYTREWLQHYFKGIFSGIYFSHNHFVGGTEKTKGDICEERGVDLFIDDILEYCVQVNQKGIWSFLFNQPWNQDYFPQQGSRIVRVNSWRDILEKI